MKLVLAAGRGISRAIVFLQVYANWFSAFVVLVLMFLISVDIVARYAAHAPIPGTFEIGQFLMVFIVFLALAQTQADRQHIRVEIITMRLKGKARTLMEMLPCLAGLFLYGLIVWSGWGWAWQSFQLKEYSAGIVNVPLYPSKIALVAGCSIFCLRFALELGQHIGRLLKSTAEAA